MADIRRERIRLVKQAPEPLVINIPVVLGFDQPREFQWGGVGLRAPPLSYRLGLRLMVAANALRELRTQKAPASQVAGVLRSTSSLLREAVHPIKCRHWLTWRRAFRRDDPEAVEGLCCWLVDVLDEAAPPPPPKETVTVDLVDRLAEFCRVFPAWVTNGVPRSWAHYQFGLRHLARQAAREDLRNAIATRAGQADPKGFKEYSAEVRAAAGW